ncbi:hypothetical protein M8C21_027472, partial [Ambrosia artemisiifolia]
MYKYGVAHMDGLVEDMMSYK